MNKRVSIRLSGISTTDTTHPDYIDNLKQKIEGVLNEKGVLRRTWVKEIIIGKEVKQK